MTDTHPTTRYHLLKNSDPKQRYTLQGPIQITSTRHCTKRKENPQNVKPKFFASLQNMLINITAKALFKIKCHFKFIFLRRDIHISISLTFIKQSELLRNILIPELEHTKTLY